jgi:hypothetical protein
VGERHDLAVTRVHDLLQTIEFLFYALQGGPGSVRDPHPRRAWLEDLLKRLPVELRNQAFMLGVRAFREVRENKYPFEFEVSEFPCPPRPWVRRPS